MTQSVLGVVVGLAVLAVAGRVQRGSFGSSGSRAFEDARSFGSYSSGETPEKVIRWAIKYHLVEDPYPMEVMGLTEEIAEEANERAGLRPERFSGAYGKTGLRYSTSELISLLAELHRMEETWEEQEGDEDSPRMLRQMILWTIGIEEV